MVRRSEQIAAIGNFDGVHRGHQALIARTIELAKERGAKAGAVVFNPHPRRFFRPDDPPFLITTAERRDALLREAGVETLTPIHFDESIASLSPEQFIRDVLKERHHLSGVVVGGDFRFGKNRAGDAAMLQALCARHGVLASVLDVISDEGHSDKIGSTAIREAILSGAVDRAADMLGRLWSVEGAVEQGNRIGRTIGFPTANLTLGELIEPRRGVYAVRTAVEDRVIDGVANFGRKPTVGAAAPLLEVYLFDFDGDLYGETIDVAFVRFIRDEMKFDGLEALKAQIAADCDAARMILAEDACR